MKFLGTGLSHKTAPIELREKLAQQTSDLERSFKDLTRSKIINEACIVSTCNRVEFYVAGDAEASALAREVRSFVQSACGMRLSEIEPHLYQHEGDEALRHLFRVASSLDSMVLGEPQILGQIKEAFAKAEAAAAVGPNLSRVFRKAFSVAKRVRTETGIAENAVSMSFAAVELSRNIFETLEDKVVLLIGAGKMSTLAAKHLKNQGVREIRVANRSLERASQLAEEIGGVASNLADLELLMEKADIVISSTASQEYVVKKRQMGKVIRRRRYRPILFVDLAVPRDIDPKVADLENVFVYDVDDLEGVVEDNRDARSQEAEAAGRLIEDELVAFLRWERSQQVVPVIKALRTRALEIADQEAERTLKSVPPGPAQQKMEKTIRKMSQAIVNKMLHPVMAKLKNEGAEGDPAHLMEAIGSLFEIDVQNLAEEEPEQPAEGEDPENVVPINRDQEKKTS